MRHVDMRKLPAAAQEERRRQVVGLRQRGLTYREIAEQVGLSAYPGRYDALRDPSLGDAEECCSEDAEAVCPR
jgi:hypothetical protein